MFTYTSPVSQTTVLHRRLLWPVIVLAGILALGRAQEAQPLPVQPPQSPTPPEEPTDWDMDDLDLFHWELPMPDPELPEFEFPEFEFPEYELHLQAEQLREEASEQAEEARRQAEEMRRQIPEIMVTPSTGIRTVVIPDQLTQAYQDAYGQILDEKWAQARQAFDEFLKRYGQQRGNRYVDDARFWICYAMEKSKLPDAEVFEAYHQFIQEFANSNWLDDAKANLIKIGRRLSAKSKKAKAEYGPIVEELEQDHNVEVALAALNRMREFDNKSSVQAVFKLYDRTENGELRKKIVSALRNFEDPNVVARLSDIAAKDPDGEVRKEAIGVLRRQGSEAAIKALVNIAANLDDPSERRNVVNALGRTSSDAVVPVLLNLAINDPHVRVRTEAVSALARIGTPEAQEALIKIMEGK